MSKLGHNMAFLTQRQYELEHQLAQFQTAQKHYRQQYLLCLQQSSKSLKDKHWGTIGGSRQQAF